MMSSPLAGGYISAYNRRKAVEDEQEQRIKLTANVILYFDEQRVFEQQLAIEVDQKALFDSDGAQIEVTASIIDSGLCCLVFDISGKGAFSSWGQIGRQQVNVESGESLTTLVAGNERVKITVSCSPEQS